MHSLRSNLNSHPIFFCPKVVFTDLLDPTLFASSSCTDPKSTTADTLNNCLVKVFSSFASFSLIFSLKVEEIILSLYH